MPHHHHITIEGRIGDIFFHRFVIELASGKKILADIGPKGAEAFSLENGMEIEADGEMKPSELKIERIARKGGKVVRIPHKEPDHHGPHAHHNAPADPNTAKQAVALAGFETIGEPRRKPKHFEVLGRKGNTLIECHVEFDGHIRKEKPVDSSDHKWADCVKHAA